MALICLFFDNLDPPQKVVYTARVDQFESFQVTGLYDVFKASIEGNFTVTAMANGVRSRPAVFKQGLEVAPILNLVVVLDEGKIDSLVWRNNCYDLQVCDTNDCKDTSVIYEEETFEEVNCMRTDCQSVDDNTCDTQVFVTWVGRDKARDDCTSDNYRISGFTNYSIVSYY